jgi:hypothetical protein
MKPSPVPRPRPPAGVHWSAKAGVALLAAGVLATVWTGEWRWLAVGSVALLVAVVLGAPARADR